MSNDGKYPERFLDADLQTVDADVGALIGLEEARQAHKLILIASESICPKAVRDALASVFTNLYAEGYPSLRMTTDERQELTNFSRQLAFHRRYSDRRYYRGCDFVNFVEALAQKRVAELFATDAVPAEQVFANVQPLSGAAANNAVYEAFLNPGDVVMGMSLSFGGHLTHGSPVNRSGKHFRIVSYQPDKATGKLDYNALRALAAEHKPRMIIAGYSAYPWAVDWRRFREVADAVPGGCILMADIAHTAGLVAAGQYPNPVGHADVVTFTTHKTLCGPRGAVILATDPEKAKKIDRAVFPGEQGGPHINTIAAKAVAFRIAQSPEFKQLQRDIIGNAKVLADGLARRGLKLAYGGTDTHLALIDLSAIQTPTGVPLRGDIATRILDLCGLTANKNTILGDENAFDPSGVRLGTTWVTQRGLGPAEMDKIAELVHRVLTSIAPFLYKGRKGYRTRGKIDLAVMEDVKREVAALTANAPPAAPAPSPGVSSASTIEVSGERALVALQAACTADVAALQPGQSCRSLLLDGAGNVLDEVLISALPPTVPGRCRYQIAPQPHNAQRVKLWLRSLSDGYIKFDEGDVLAKVDGPVVVEWEKGTQLFCRNGPTGASHKRAASPFPSSAPEGPQICLAKPFFIGQSTLLRGAKPTHDKTPFQFTEPTGPPNHSALYAEHAKLTQGRFLVPFAGWLMPIQYVSIAEEHMAVRSAAGLFDISHMGVLEITGPSAARFLDLVLSNYVLALKPGRSQYNYVLAPDGSVMDDVFLYCLAPDRFMLVVNASNQEKVKAWLEALNSRRVVIDQDWPHKEVDVTATIRDLKSPASGSDQRVGLSLQGPRSLTILQSLATWQRVVDQLGRLTRLEFTTCELAGVSVIVSRTGYTGEPIGYELYVHPEQAP
ncbi:MAG: aminotransferase class I/II-fold pyridoxal phosphate-dependent enzyme, partial [Planctomycetes bacterium]|nr:aminotransferase class I/II-fold pyridoxal phosphate-dependent enzyme [Planctomycetota bacterium]